MRASRKPQLTFSGAGADGTCSAVQQQADGREVRACSFGPGGAAAEPLLLALASRSNCSPALAAPWQGNEITDSSKLQASFGGAVKLRRGGLGTARQGPLQSSLDRVQQPSSARCS